MSRRLERRRHRAQGGFTLIEAIVAMAVISVSIVALIGSFSTAQRSAAAAVTQAQAEVLMRQVGDTLRQPLPYVPCAGINDYSVASGAAISDIDIVPGGTVTGGGTAVAHVDCSSNNATITTTCPPGDTCDYGVQRITVTVTYSTGTLTRVVYKGAY